MGDGEWIYILNPIQLTINSSRNPPTSTSHPQNPPPHTPEIQATQRSSRASEDERGAAAPRSVRTIGATGSDVGVEAIVGERYVVLVVVGRGGDTLKPILTRATSRSYIP